MKKTTILAAALAAFAGMASAQDYPNQAFRYGRNAWGIQFHAELTRAMMHRWVVHGAHRFDLPGAQMGRDHLHGRMLWDIRLRLWLERFLALIFEHESQAGLALPGGVLEEEQPDEDDQDERNAHQPQNQRAKHEDTPVAWVS